MFNAVAVADPEWLMAKNYTQVLQQRRTTETHQTWHA